MPRGNNFPAASFGALPNFRQASLAKRKRGVPFISLTGIVHEPEEHAGTRATLFHRFTDTDYKSVGEVMDDFSSTFNCWVSTRTASRKTIGKTS